MNRVAIAVSDLERLDQNVLESLLTGRLESSRPILAIDTLVFSFTCEELEAAVVCDIIRGINAKSGDQQSEVFVQISNRPWARVPRNVPLTIKVGGRPKLNPVVFVEYAEKIAASSAPPVKKLGR